MRSFLQKKRRYRAIWLIGTIGLVILLFSCVCVEPVLAAVSEKVTVFSQKHSLLGPVDLSIGKSGVRIDVKQQRCVLVGQPPNWLMVFYNPQVKIKYERPLKNLLINPIFDLRPPKPNFKNISVHPARFNNLETLLMTADVDFLISDEFFFQREEKPERVKRVFYFGYFDREKAFEPAAVRFVEAVFGMRPNSGIPVAARYQFANGKRASFVETQLKTTKMVDPNKFFSVPAGYKKAKSELEVSSEKRLDLMNDWAHDMLD